MSRSVGSRLASGYTRLRPMVEPALVAFTVGVLIAGGSHGWPVPERWPTVAGSPALELRSCPRWPGS